MQPLAWSSDTVCPAMVSDVSRAGPGLAATENCTWPLPAPVAPLAIVTQGAALLALQAQPSGLVTWTAPLPAAAATLTVDALMPNVQPGPCVTLIAWSATRTDPERVCPGLAATRICTCPDPLPVCPAVILIQSVVLDADHVQPAPAATATAVAPPACGAA